jgi:cysteine desulfurase family protein (TIGR01976 family)
MSIEIDTAAWRRHFPGLGRKVGGRPAAFLDGPAGSQVPQCVIDAMGDYLAHRNANTGGFFVTSKESESLLDEAGQAAADFVGTSDGQTVIFGPNMTTLTVALATAMSREWGPGDEILLTRLEHDANFTPWVDAAKDAGAELRQVDIRTADGTLDLDSLEAQLSPRTRLVAVCAASNCLGSVTPLPRIVELAHAQGAEVFVDAVHYAPHRRIDVTGWNCDFLACSPYKFFGPHMGMLWGRRERLEALPARKLRPASGSLPGRWMPGTPSHEGIAGTLAAIDYLAELGRESGANAMDRPAALDRAFETIASHENSMALHALNSLGAMGDVTVHGVTDPARLEERVPTFSFTHRRLTPAHIAEKLAEQGIFVWHGNFYALPVTDAMGLDPHGVVRVGLLHYNTHDEIDRLCEGIDSL